MSVFFQEPATDEKIPAHLGLDLGCYTSKEALAWTDPNASVQTRILRVNLSGTLAERERHHGPNSMDRIFEFIAHAALENGRFVLGRESLCKNRRVPIKVILDHLAGIGNLNELPHAQWLLKWYESGDVTSRMERDALREHLTFLGEAACKKAEDNGLVITRTNITYPGFLCPREGDLDFEKLKSFTLKFIRSVPPWKDSQIEIQMVSEGHGAALSICEEYEDALRTRDHRQLWEHFRGLRGNDGLIFFHVDGGSSTFNFQRMTLDFDREAGIVHNKWLDDPAWSSGTIGGSYLLNDTIQEMIMPQLEQINADMLEGEVAAVMRDFETKKWSCSFSADGPPLRLHGTHPWVVVRLTASQLQQAFSKVFRSSLRQLKRELLCVADLEKDFVVMFSGGCFCNPGVWNEAETIVGEVKKIAEDLGLQLRYGRLADFDTNWSSSVCVGAAISTISLPRPVKLVLGSAIGVQVQTTRRTSPLANEWRGADKAQVLLHTGHCRNGSAEFNISSTMRRKTRFSFLCAPVFDPSAGSIMVDDLSQEERGSLTTYDLSWTVKASELPRGPFTLTLSGSDYNLLTTRGDNDLEHAFRNRPICLLLRCDASGKRVQERSASNKRWLLVIRTHPGSKLLIIDEAEEMPLSCAACSDELHQACRKCQNCDKFGVCEDCYWGDGLDGLEHDEEHEFREYRY